MAERTRSNKVTSAEVILDSMIDGVAVTDTSMRIVQANGALARMFGVRSPRQLIGRTVPEVLGYSSRERSRLTQGMKELREGAAIENVEGLCESADGKLFPVLLSVTPVHDRDGEFIGGVAILRDITDRKQMEEELRESEERFRQFFENAPEYCYMISPDGIILNANKSALRTLGYRKGEIVGKPLKTIYAPESLPKMRKLFAKWRKTGKLVNEEMIILTKNGERRAVLLSADAVRGKDGEVTHSVSAQRDITELKRAEEVLKDSEERYALAQRVANIGSWDWDIPTGDLSWSDTIEPMFGFRRGEFGATYEAFLDCVHPEDRQRVVDSVNACVEEGKGYDIEHRIIWPDGTIRWVSETGNVIRDDSGKAVRMLGVVRDITEHKKAEEEIVLARDYTDNIIRSMADMLIVIDPDGKIRTINRAAGELLGYKEDELVGQPVDRILAPGTRTPFSGKGLKELAEKGSIHDWDMTYRAKGGEHIPVSFCGSVMRDKNGDPTHIVGAARDMREIKGLLNDLKELKETHAKLVHVERMSTIGALTAGVSHTIGNMLTNLLSSSSGNVEEIAKLEYVRQLDNLLENSSNPNEIYEGYQKIRQSFTNVRPKYSRQLGKLFKHPGPNTEAKYRELREEILSTAYSRIHSYSDGLRNQTNLMNESIKSLLSLAKSGAVKRTPTDINRVLRTAHFILSNYEKHNIRFVEDLTPGLPKIEVDSHQVLDCFVNIMLNGIEAMEKGGILTYGTGLYNGKGIEVRITDTGHGIPQEAMEKVFEPFFTTKEKGTGLGLSMALSIVKAHGGGIDVQSSSKGTTFSIKLPTPADE